MAIRCRPSFALPGSLQSVWGLDDVRRISKGQASVTFYPSHAKPGRSPESALFASGSNIEVLDVRLHKGVGSMGSSFCGTAAAPRASAASPGGLRVGSTLVHRTEPGSGRAAAPPDSPGPFESVRVCGVECRSSEPLCHPLCPLRTVAVSPRASLCTRSRSRSLEDFHDALPADTELGRDRGQGHTFRTRNLHCGAKTNPGSVDLLLGLPVSRRSPAEIRFGAHREKLRACTPLPLRKVGVR